MPPLDGITVIDLTRVLAGPFCTMLLGDMGADVIKVEEPEHGDDSRGWAPFVGGWSSYFLGVNRSKNSLALDLKQPKAAEVLRRLLGTADVLVENFRPGSLARLGFGFDEVSALNPSLIYCSISGYGQSGPRRELTGYDPVIQAEAGLMDVTGFPDGPPTRVGVAITDYLAGLYALQGILLALRDRDKTGKGQHVDIALFDSMMTALTMQVGIFQATNQSPGRMGNDHPSIAPYGSYQCADGLVQVGVANEGLWRRFAPVVEIDPDDERFATGADRSRNRGELGALIEKAFEHGTREHWLARLAEAGVPAGAIRSIDEVYEWDQTRSQGLVIDIEHPVLGRIELPGPPLRFDDGDPQEHTAPPGLGQHTQSVMTWLDEVDS